MKQGQHERLKDAMAVIDGHQDDAGLEKLLVELVVVARGGGMSGPRETLNQIMPTDSFEAQMMVGRIARLRQAIEVLHNYSMELAFARQ